MPHKLLKYSTFILFSLLCQSLLSQDNTPPDKPVIDYVTVDTASNDVLIFWEPSDSADVEWYYLYYEVNTINGMEGVKFDSTDAGQYQHRHTNTEAGERSVLYSVTALDSSNNESLRKPGLHSTIFTFPEYDDCKRRMTIHWTRYIGWNGNLSGYIIYYSINNSPFTALYGEVAKDSFTIQTEIEPNTEYRYFVEAIRYDGTISRSNITTIYTHRPGSPSDFELEYVTIPGPNLAEINFFFTDTSSVEQLVLLRSSDKDSEFRPLKYLTGLSSGINTVRDESILTAVNQYYYRIGVATGCNEVYSTTNLGVNILLHGTFNKNLYRNELSWNPYEEWDTGVEEYEIYRSGLTGDLELLATVPSGVTEFTDELTELAGSGIPGRLRYQVVARKSGESVFSESNTLEIDITTQPLGIPNAFTPNQDGINDRFRPVLNFIPKEYLMIIYDRYGVTLYQSEDPLEGWDGKIRNGSLAIEGVYVYHIQYVSFDGTAFSQTGHLTLIIP